MPGKSRINSIILFVLAASLLYGQASPTPPVAPQVVPSGVRPIVFGSIIPIHAGTDLQAAYNAAACGSDLVLDAGITQTGNFFFNKHCSAGMWSLIEAAGCNANTVPIPTYVTTASVNSASVPPFPPPSLTNYAMIRSTNGAAPIVFASPVSYSYLGCIEVTATVSQNALISMATLSETVVSQLPDHLMLDRDYIHGVPASSTVQMSRGILAAGSNISMVNLYISQIYSSSGDAQAILLTYGTAGYLITNNFLSASTEIIMAGGTGATPGYNCTVAASPAPTTTSATVNTCVDGNSASVATPAIGTVVMFKTSSGSPAYLPTDSMVITGNTAGALTFGVIHAPPIAGAAKALWGIVPTDITITKNFLYKPPSWNPSDPSYDGVTRSSKNCIEDKYGQRWNITANVCINTWNNGQNFAFNINVNDQNGDCPWCISSDVHLANNVFKNIAGEFVIISAQSFSGPCPGYLKRVLIENNLFFVPGAAPFIASGGTVFELAGYSGCGLAGGGTDSLQIIHNHLLGSGINMQLASGLPYNFTNLVIKDNITQFSQYRYTNQCPDSPGFVDGTLCLTADVSTGPTWTASNNAVINSGAIEGGQGVSDATITSRYGSIVLPTIYDATLGTNYAGAPFANYSGVNTDYHNFRVTSGPWLNAASDGTNPGVNFTTLDAAIGGGPAPSLSCPVVVTGTVGTPFSASLIASGGTGGYTYAVNAGPLPTGLTLNTSTGVISGTPTLAGSFPYTAGVTDASNQTASAPCSITIAATSLSCSPKTGLPTPTVEDVLLQTSMAFGAACTNNLKGSGTCNVIDVQRVVTAAFGGACVIGP